MYHMLFGQFSHVSRSLDFPDEEATEPQPERQSYIITVLVGAPNVTLIF